MFLAKIRVTLKPAVNDPQGLTVLNGLKALGFQSAQTVRMGKYVEIMLKASDQLQAEALAMEMCDQLLANPIIEDFSCEVTNAPESTPVQS